MSTLLPVLEIIGGIACFAIAVAFALAIAVKAFDVFAKLFKIDI